MSGFRRDPIRSKKLRNAARGQRCTLNFPGICNYDPETVVLAHLHDESFGMAQKADDTSAVHACFACHTSLDQHTHGLSEADLYRTLLRALQRTIRRLAIMQVIIVPRDVEKAAAERPVKPRKDRDQRAKINSRTEWPQGRKIPSRPMRQKEPSL